MTAEPIAAIPFTTTRYRCPICNKTGSSRTRIQKHVDTCAHRPETRACPTCVSDVWRETEPGYSSRVCSKGISRPPNLVTGCPLWVGKTEEAWS